jgi:hypothetical protein
MADALASGASVRKDVGVQVPPRSQIELMNLAVLIVVNFSSPSTGD